MLHKDTFKNVYFNGAKGVVFIGEKILVYRRDENTHQLPLFIDLPGGGRESEESPFDTFAREVKEEFGIKIEKGDIQFSSPFPSINEPGKNSFFLVAKTSRFTEKDIVFGKEGIEWLLITPDEFIHHSNGIKRQQQRVANYLQGKDINK